MEADAVKADYAKELKDLITIRRYTGTGSNRPFFDVTARSRVTGYQPNELRGGIQQGDSKIIVYADDLTSKGFVLPVKSGATSSDKVRIRGVECAILGADDRTRRVDGILIALELHVRG